MKLKNVVNLRGQVLVLFALMIPVMMLFVGLALDIGWYYLNVSRLQNAAALAGARAIRENSKQIFGEVYYGSSLVGNKLPEDFDHYENVFDHGFGELNNYKPIEKIQKHLVHGRNHVEEYTRKNLADSNVINADTATDWKIASATDGWSISAADSDKQVNGEIELKYKLVDGKNDKHGQLYYVVTLSEKIRHFFLSDGFDDMTATVKAVVLLEPHDKDLLSAMWKLERTMVIDNWEYQNRYKGTDGFYYAGKWNHYMSGTTNNNTGISYHGGDVYRTESVGITPSRKNGTNGSDGQFTAANATPDSLNGNFFGEGVVDSLNIDFQAEFRIKKQFTTDWDLDESVAAKLSNFNSYNHVDSDNSWGVNNGDDKRILFNAEFNAPFATRDKTAPADPLWVRIESDPLIPQEKITKGEVKNVDVYNSVRQITLNFNSDNSEQYPDNSPYAGNYKYRPYFIFYTGPEHIDYKTETVKRRDGTPIFEDGQRVTRMVRRSKPVVVNLNDNLNAVLFLPNSPVVINGNNKKWTGFIIAKCFLAAVTAEDMTSNVNVELNDGFGYKETVTFNCREGTDGYGNTVYVERIDLLTEQAVKNAHPNITFTTDSNGNMSFYENVTAPKYPVINFPKSSFKNCTNLADYFTKTAEYIEANYTKAKYAQLMGISEWEVSMVTFPDEKDPLYNKYGNFSGVKIPVATVDLLDYDPDPNAAPKDDKYVKVMLGDQVKYIEKQNLPYVRVKWNQYCAYVCLYDLKTGLGNGLDETEYICVKPTDDSFTPPTTSGDNSSVVFLNPGNKWNDTWVIDKSLFDSVKSSYASDKLEFVEEDGYKYAMLKTDIAAASTKQLAVKYRKVTVGEDDFYVEEINRERDRVNHKLSRSHFYTKVVNNKDADGNEINYIIVDEDGNILTKSLPPNSYRKRINKEPEKIDDESLINDPGGTLEVVYKKETFNLNFVEYSSFNVELLKRKIYKYLDEGGSVDMFFTTIRAGWID